MLETDPAVAPNITAWQEIPERKPVFEGFPIDLDHRIKDLLEEMNIFSLHLHKWQRNTCPVSAAYSRRGLSMLIN